MASDVSMEGSRRILPKATTFVIKMLSFASWAVHRARFGNWPACGSSSMSNRVIADVLSFSGVAKHVKVL